MTRLRAPFALSIAAALLLSVHASAQAETPPAEAENSAASAANAGAASTAAAAPTPADPAAPPAAADPAANAVPTVPEKLPQAIAQAPLFDAGKVRKGRKIEAEFVIANLGEGILRIKDAQPSCGCTVASFDKEIAPGATGKVRARVATESFDGAIAKHITVLTNDPATPRLQLTIRADILSFVRMSPTYARLLHVQTQTPAVSAVTIWATDDTALEIREVRSPFAWVTTSVRRPTEAEKIPDVPANQWRLEVSIGAEAPVGPLRDALTVVTNHPEEPEVEIPLSGYVRTLLHAQPAVADFGALAKGAKDPKRFVLKLFNFGQEAVELRTVSTDLSFVTAGQSAEEAGRRFRLELKLAPDAPKGKFAGTLRVETSSALMPVVEIPIRGKVE